MTPLPRDLLFESILDDGTLGALPSLLADVCGARSAWFHWDSGNGDIRMFADNGYFPADYKTRYADEFAMDDPWLAAARRSDRVNAFWDYSEVVSDASFERSRIWNDMARPSGDDTFFCMGAILTAKDGKGAIALHRGRKRGRFGDDAVHRIQTLAQDFRFMFAARAAVGVSESYGHALIIADGRRVSYANAAAEAYLSSSRGLYIAKGKLFARCPSDAFERALAMSLPPHCQPSVIQLKQPDHDLQISLTPLVVAGRKALIRFRPPIAPRSPLSPRETEVLTRVSRDLRIDAIAYELGLSRVTVEAHLASVRRKLGAKTLPAAVMQAVRKAYIC